jgi:hypothetical protein
VRFLLQQCGDSPANFYFSQTILEDPAVADLARMAWVDTQNEWVLTAERKNRYGYCGKHGGLIAPAF